ncbi:MAG: hypothetical protein Q9187_008005, partial [Circinaria calcarea]
IAVITGHLEIARYLINHGARCDISSVFSSSGTEYSNDLANCVGVFPSGEFGDDVSKAQEINQRTDIMRLLLDAGCDEIPAVNVLDPRNLELPRLQLIENLMFMLFNHENSGLESHTIQNDLNLIVPVEPFVIRKDAFVHNVMEWQTEWLRILKRFSFNYQATGELGKTCLHKSLNYQVYKHKSWCRSYRVRELKWLLQNKADPCALFDVELTPTMLALLFGLTSEWFEALSTTGISVEAVVLHTLKIASPMLVKDVREWFDSVINEEHEELPFVIIDLDPPFNQDLYDSLSNVSTLRAYMIKVFAEHGCHINTTEFDDPNIYDLSASGVDYQPSTIYDPERTKTEIRKRNSTVTSG